MNFKYKKLYYRECRLAARQYYDCDEVWDELKVGTELKLVRDMDNANDKNAVAVVYTRPESLRVEGTDEDDNTFHLGYVPRTDTGAFAPFLEMGWNDMFECRICKIDPELHYEHQITMSIKIKRNKNVG